MAVEKRPSSDPDSALPVSSAGPADDVLQAPEAMAVLVVDIVDSVGLMQRHEATTVRVWADCVRHARHAVLPQMRGALVKSLGDGLMARFPVVADAVCAAFLLHEHLTQANAGLPEDAKVVLRAGIHATEAWTDGIDLYGAGVNMAARLGSIAGPGETILSVEARDEIAGNVDIDCEDLGICYIKSFGDGVRAYRASRPGVRASVVNRRDDRTPMQPTVAVIPFSMRSAGAEHAAVGDLIADGVIDRLSRSPNIRVISRLSTSFFRDRADALQAIATHLGATYVLGGGYAVNAGRLLVTAELTEVQTQEVVWADRLVGSIEDLLEAHSELAQQLAQAVHVAVFDAEMERVSTQPLPTLASYSLLAGGINLMHRASRAHFNRTQEVLEQLIERHGRVAAPRAWLANWYVLRGTRGLSDSRAHDAEQALAAARSALACDPSDARSMAIEGFVHCHLRKDLTSARRRCAQAIGANPNCAMAWLYMGAIEAFEGEGARAVDATQRALALSPIDPQRYYYESLAATAALAAQDHGLAEALARASLARNRLHSSTWRVLTIALVAQQRIAEASQALREVLHLEPDLTIDSYIERMPNGTLATGHAWARSLAAAGLPARTTSFQPRGELQ